MTQHKNSPDDDIPRPPIFGIVPNLPELSATLSRLRQISDTVSFLLMEFPDARNSDGLLFALFLGLVQGMKWFLELSPDHIRLLSQLDTVRRMRQKLQAEDPETYGPTDPEVRKWRTRKRRAVEELLKIDR